MKRLSDVVKNTVDNSKSPENDSQNPADELLTEITETFPDYMFNDANWVGYPDAEMQESVYNIASYGTFNADTNSILDVGCGRGDYGHYIKTAVNPDIEYTGIDVNEFAIKVGKHKYSNLNLDLHANVFNSDWLSERPDFMVDWVMHITNLTVDYNLYSDIFTENRRYDYFKEMLSLSMRIARSGAVFILLNDNQENSAENQYLTHSFSELAKVLYGMNYAFAIDNTDYSNIFKLLVYNNKF